MKRNGKVMLMMLEAKNEKLSNYAVKFSVLLNLE